jgi:SulP family sulfate permease
MKKFFTFNDIIAGTISGVVIVIIAIAFTALIFKGPLTPYFSIGITCALIGSCLVNLLTASFSSIPISVAQASPITAAILAIIFLNIFGHHLPSDALLPTLLMTLSLVSLIAGGSMFLLGYFNLGQIARFLPFPVLGGIIAGTAWIMMKSSFLLMVNNDLSINNLTKINTISLYAAGIGFSLLLLIFVRNSKRAWVMPMFILLASLAVNVILQIIHVPHAEAIQTGWSFSSFQPTFSFNLINLDSFDKIDWESIFTQTSYILSLVALIIILLLLNVSSLETVAKGKADLEQELKLTGLSNLASGALLGVPAYLSFSGSVLNKNAGAEHRVSGIIASLVCVIVLFIYPDVLTYVPKPIIGGLLLYIGYVLLIEWLYEGWKKLPKIDYFIVLAIVLTVALLGFLPGIIIGIIITCVVFIIRYARIDAIKFATTGAQYHSNVIRPLYQQKWQAEKGKSLQIIKLQGYLFFGSAKILLDKITYLIESDPELKFILFDFQFVNGLDSSAIYHFIRLEQLVGENQLIIFTNCGNKIISQFKRQGIINGSKKIKIFPDLDQGLEWCENQLLKLMPEQLQVDSVSSTLNQLIPEENQRELFKKYLKRKEVPAKSILFKQNDPADCLYFIESGEVAVYLKNDQSVIRVSKSGAGTIVGEIGFYLHTKRTATVTAETDCVIYELTENALLALGKEHAEIALAFHKGIVKALALRIIQTNYELMAVSR